MAQPTIELSDSEWMSLIMSDRDGLPACCGNVGALRDTITSLMFVGPLRSTLEEYRARWQTLTDGHEMDDVSPELTKLTEQVNAALDALGPEPPPPPPDPDAYTMPVFEHIHGDPAELPDKTLPEVCPDGMECRRWPRWVDFETWHRSRTWTLTPDPDRLIRNSLSDARSDLALTMIAADIGPADRKRIQKAAYLIMRGQIELERLHHGHPQRGDDVEAWIRRFRDRIDPTRVSWGVVDDLLDDYRLHADTGTPLTEDASEGNEP